MPSVTVVGLGYVGLSIAALLSEQHEVTAVDIDDERVTRLSNGQLPLKDPDLLPVLTDPEKAHLVHH